ncbi:MAG: hypothetical protein MI920_16360 [Kiloniellales bacterium]|nr:hypothetical protein [Kiloniellales bacterium]
MAEQEPLQCIQGSDGSRALEGAVRLLRGVEPFSKYQFGPFVSVLLGQIRRRHYVFTIRGKQVLGYAGWALCDPDVARAWVQGNRAPSEEECYLGSTVVFPVFYAKSPGALAFQVRHLKGLLPGREGIWRRDYGERWRIGWGRNATVSNEEATASAGGQERTPW